MENIFKQIEHKDCNTYSDYERNTYGLLYELKTIDTLYNNGNIEQIIESYIDTDYDTNELMTESQAIDTYNYDIEQVFYSIARYCNKLIDTNLCDNSVNRKLEKILSISNSKSIEKTNNQNDTLRFNVRKLKRMINYIERRLDSNTVRDIDFYGIN